jgi:F-type H+-transporting ATPase subunit b
VKRLILILCLAAPVVIAQERAKEADKKEAGSESEMLPWMWANFLILAGAVGYLSKKYGGPFLAARSESIRKDIVDAEKIKTDAMAKVAEVNAKLANLGSEIEAMKEENRREQAREGERLEARNKAELARVRQQAEQEIQSATKAARLELRRYAASLALELAEKKVAARMNPELQKQLASEFVRNLS